MILGSIQSLSHVQPFVTPWTAACQAALFLGFSWQEHWSGLPPPPWVRFVIMLYRDLVIKK